jgi:hypothetical protein
MNSLDLLNDRLLETIESALVPLPLYETFFVKLRLKNIRFIKEEASGYLPVNALSTSSVLPIRIKMSLSLMR